MTIQLLPRHLISRRIHNGKVVQQPSPSVFRRACSAQRQGRRRGTLVVCVLICLLITGSLAAATTHAALRWRRSIRLEQQLRQTELLLDAGILRAAMQLRSSTDYRGETWRPSRESVGFESPVVEIKVTDGDGPASRQVEIVAELGATLSEIARTNPSHTRRSHTFSVVVADTPSNSDSSSVE